MRRDVFQAIADPNRRAIIGLLANRSLTLNEIADHFPVSRPAISKHVKILTECGLIVITPHGRERHCEARLQRLKEISDWSDQYRQFWTARLDALEAYLARTAAEQPGVATHVVPPARAPQKKTTPRSNSPKSEQAARRGKPRKA